MAAPDAVAAAPAAVVAPAQAQSVAQITQSVLQQRVYHLLACVQPNAPSELRRLTIASYICDLIKKCFQQHNRPVEAFMFGSVPLRTYLPDGDIDISIFTPLSGPNDPLRESWTTQLLRALEREGNRRDAPFSIRNCQIIQAEVKLIKCVVANVVVDVSFNALGGLCTVAFLEWVDRAIGRGHIFKRSVVLVKAWCYYEARLLGAHHSLISSYALEAMVLYVFNLHGATLTTPLQVLQCFLQVFAAFDWDKYCLSMLGPIPLSSFPNPTLDRAVIPEGPQLLDPMALREAVRQYSVQPTLAVAALDTLLGTPTPPPPQQQKQDHTDSATSSLPIALPQKHLNIMDPLLPNNNLGRSVSKASFARIRKALAYGAADLQRIMQQEPLAAAEGIDAYFRNAWRSPTRMAADNQVFQSRLAMGGAMFLQQQQQPGSGGGGGRGGGAQNPHSMRVPAGGFGLFDRRGIGSASSPDIIAISEMQMSAAGANVSLPMPLPVVAGGPVPPLSVSVVPPAGVGEDTPAAMPAESFPSGSSYINISAAASAAAMQRDNMHQPHPQQPWRSVSQPVSPALSPRSTTSTHPSASRAVLPMHNAATARASASLQPAVVTMALDAPSAAIAVPPLSGGYGMPPLPHAVGVPVKPSAYHSSLPTSPVIADSIGVAAGGPRSGGPPPRMQMPPPLPQSAGLQTAVGGSGDGGNTSGMPVPAPAVVHGASLGSDIFTADLSALMQNLTIARSCQLQEEQNASGAAAVAAAMPPLLPLPTAASSAAAAAAAAAAVAKDDDSCNDTQEAAAAVSEPIPPLPASEPTLASLPPVRVSAPASTASSPASTPKGSFTPSGASPKRPSRAASTDRLAVAAETAATAGGSGEGPTHLPPPVPRMPWGRGMPKPSPSVPTSLTVSAPAAKPPPAAAAAAAASSILPPAPLVAPPAPAPTAAASTAPKDTPFASSSSSSSANAAPSDLPSKNSWSAVAGRPPSRLSPAQSTRRSEDLQRTSSQTQQPSGSRAGSVASPSASITPAVAEFTATDEDFPVVGSPAASSGPKPGGWAAIAAAAPSTSASAASAPAAAPIATSTDQHSFASTAIGANHSAPAPSSTGAGGGQSGSNTPSAVSPRVGSWAEAAARSPRAQIPLPRREKPIAGNSNGGARSTGPSLDGGRRSARPSMDASGRRSTGPSIDGVRRSTGPSLDGGRRGSVELQFSLTDGDFPTLANKPGKK